MPSIRFRPAAWLAVAAAVLALVLAGHVAVEAVGTDVPEVVPAPHESMVRLGNATVIAYSFEASPGDEIHIDPNSAVRCEFLPPEGSNESREWCVQGGRLVLDDNVALVLVEGGDLDAFVEGDPSASVHLEVIGGRIWERRWEVVRPAVPAGKQASPEGLDRTWVTAAFVIRDDPLDRGEIDLYDGTFVNPAYDLWGHSIALRQRYAVIADPILATLEWIAAAAVVALAGVTLVAARPKGRPESQGPGLEPALNLVTAAEGYLVSLRRHLRTAGATLALIALMLPTFVYGWAGELVQGDERHEQTMLLRLFVLAAVAWLGVVALWLRQYLAVRRELARWHETARTMPQF